MSQFGNKAIEFYSNLNFNTELPQGIELLDPFVNPETQSIVQSFYSKFFCDDRERIMLLGINPGRFGAGVTGIAFTDPIRLEDACGIPNNFEKRSELSSRFVYEIIHAFGGAEEFYSRFYLSAVCPVGFVRSGRNLNYYDDKELENSLRGFILSTLNQQLRMGISRDRVFCLGEGKNYKYLQELNNEVGLFNEITALPHPRWVMQYRYKKKEEYIQSYLEELSNI